MSVVTRRQKVNFKHKKMSVRQQCSILGICRSGLLYTPIGTSSLNLDLMEKIDKKYTDHPFYGRPKMTEQLKKEGYQINGKRVGRLMQKMGIMAIYPKPNTSIRNKADRVYPYLLRGRDITRSNEVWCADITYIRTGKGFMYLVAIMDWSSRYVIAWELSNTLDGDFCGRVLKRALALGKPEIFNTDQGSQFTSDRFTQTLLGQGIQISMDGKGRALDNVFIERLWRSLKYEMIYLRQFESVPELKSAIRAYLHFYNTERIHQGLAYKTPKEVYDKIEA